MNLICPVCGKEIPLSALRDVRQLDCPHCHYPVELDETAASLLQIGTIGILLGAVLVYTVLDVFLPAEHIVLGMLVIVFLMSPLHPLLRILDWLGLLKWHRKIDKDRKI